MSIHGGPGWPSGKLVYDRCGNLPDSPENSCGLKNKCHPGRNYDFYNFIDLILSIF